MGKPSGRGGGHSLCALAVLGASWHLLTAGRSARASDEIHQYKRGGAQRSSPPSAAREEGGAEGKIYRVHPKFAS